MQTSRTKLRKLHPIFFAAGFLAAALCSMIVLAGCHSRFVEATIENRGSHALHEVEVDYPSAGFGVSNIAAHSLYHYRFKVLGSGSVKLSFTDEQGKAHTFNGPELDEGQEGSLTITVDEAAHVQWASKLRKAE